MYRCILHTRKTQQRHTTPANARLFLTRTYMPYDTSAAQLFFQTLHHHKQSTHTRTPPAQKALSHQRASTNSLPFEQGAPFRR